MRVAIDAVVETGRLAEGAICYTGDILDPDRAKYSLRYYVDLAKELEEAGCHILSIKDMAGVLKPTAAKVLVKALREEVGLPLRLSYHDALLLLMEPRPPRFGLWATAKQPRNSRISFQVLQTPLPAFNAP